MTAFGGALSINISPTAKVMTNRSTSAMRSSGQSMENSLMSSWARGSLRSLDVKSASAYSSGRRLSSSTTTSTGRSFIDASYMISRARSREWCRWTPSSLTLGPGHVFTGTRVDLDEFTGSDEQRDLHDESSLESRGLSCARYTVSLDTGLGLGDRQLDRRGQFHSNDLVVVQDQHRLASLFEIFGRLAKALGGHRHLVVGRLVHEDVVVAVAVQVLRVALVHHRLLQAFVRPVRALDDGPGTGVAQLGAHERATLARLDVLELDHREEPVVELYGDAVLNVRR